VTGAYTATYYPTDVDNYTSAQVSISVTVNASAPVVTWPSVSSLVYGQTLADADLTNGSAINVYNSALTVPGHFVWSTPIVVPVAGPTQNELQFIPDDATKYTTVSQNRQVYTVKATPVVTLNEVSTDTYGKTLANRPLSYNSASNVISHRTIEETIAVTGSISWNSTSIIPTVANNDYVATFTPSDIANYNTVVFNVNVPTTKATPIVSATVAAYSYGQTLPVNAPTLTSAVNPVNNSLVLSGGQLVWNSIDQLPVTGAYTATYHPTDVDNYTSAQVSISVTVNASAPVVTWPSISSLVYGQTLADADLTNGSAINVYNSALTVPGHFVWSTPTTVTAAGSTSNVLQFIPDNSSNYTTITNNVISVYTEKATPVVTLNAVSTDTYGKTLANRPLSYSSVNNVVSHRSSVETLIVAGAIAWNNNTTIPTVANNDYTATFTPSDINNYNTVVINVNVPTSKATPVVNGAAVAAYTYGEALPAKTITVTNVVNPNNASIVLTDGTITWNSIDVLPTTGGSIHTATFTPSSTDVANYNPAVFNVNVTVNKANPAVTWPTTTAITYGQTLSQVALTGSHYAVNTINNADVPGTFVWASATTVTPSNTNTAYRLRFIPTDLVNYYTDSTMINLIINKAVPTVNWGTFSTITYGASLSNVTITDETAVNPITGLTITGGTFAWINPTIQPNVNNSGFVRTYTPSDAANYESVQSPLLPVVVNKANPVIAQTSSPYVITYGQVLPTITATATNAINSASVNGNYEWNYTEEHLPQAGAVAPYQVRFTPMGIDAENYNIVDHAFNVQVNKAKPVVIAPTASSLVYEQTLAESLLTGGSAMNSYNNDDVAGTFTWELPTTIPNAGSHGYPVVFVPQDQNNYVNSDPIDVVVEVAKKHIDILISNLEHIYDGNQKEATFSDAEGRVDLTGMIDAKYYQGNTNILIADQAPISVGSYRVIATILPTENYEGCDTAVLIINKNASKMSNPEDEVEIVNAIIPGMNQYFKIRDYEQMKPIKVRMINANGNQVYQSDNYTNNFDMSNLPKGTYFYTVTFTLKGNEYTKTGRVEVVRK
ncbi:MAG: gliding motility-associated C-terminal domain-containing protein, partial [Bacteroidales bacterium]